MTYPCQEKHSDDRLGPVATLENIASGSQFHLAARHLVGRSKSCLLCIERPNVSGVHAEIVWDGGNWHVRDLDSRNGTFINGRKLTVGEQAVLAKGAELIFGVREHSFRLIDDSPPRLMAIATNTGEVIVVEGELMSLPSPDICDVSIFRDVDECWQVETGDGTQVIADQELVMAGSRIWRVCLPALKDRTREARTTIEPTLAMVALEFHVNRNGEHIVIELKHSNENIELEPRAHASLLLTLAQCRMNDANQNNLPDSEHGWEYRDDLAKMLGIEPPLLNLWVFRARKQFASAGIRGAAGIIERRAGSQQMRIGTGATHIIQV